MTPTGKVQELAMISVPWQSYTVPMAPAEALLHGTVFSNLAQSYIPTVMPPAHAPSTAQFANMPNAQAMQNGSTMANTSGMQMQNMGMQKKR